MNHADLRDKCRKAFGSGKIPMEARERWSVFISEERTEFTFRYEWIKDPRFYDWVRANKEHLDIRDGAEWFGVYICDNKGQPVTDYGTV